MLKEVCNWLLWDIFGGCDVILTSVEQLVLVSFFPNVNLCYELSNNEVILIETDRGICC
jgi:predicted Rdx family selenoprotein